MVRMYSKLHNPRFFVLYFNIDAEILEEEGLLEYILIRIFRVFFGVYKFKLGCNKLFNFNFFPARLIQSTSGISFLIWSYNEIAVV